MSSTETGLPDGWETKDSRWEPPAGTDADALKNYMATYYSSRSVAPAASISTEASWREPNITRSPDKARELIRGYQAQIKAYEEQTGAANAKSLSELATTESDCSSARKGGDLGFFGKGDMQKEFEQAAFALQKGQVSGVVETASGIHLIQRLE